MKYFVQKNFHFGEIDKSMTKGTAMEVDIENGIVILKGESFKVTSIPLIIKAGFIQAEDGSVITFAEKPAAKEVESKYKVSEGNTKEVAKIKMPNNPLKHSGLLNTAKVQTMAELEDLTRVTGDNHRPKMEVIRQDQVASIDIKKRADDVKKSMGGDTTEIPLVKTNIQLAVERALAAEGIGPSIEGVQEIGDGSNAVVVAKIKSPAQMEQEKVAKAVVKVEPAHTEPKTTRKSRKSSGE